MQRLREREVDNKIQITDAEIDNFLAAAAGNAEGGQSEINIAQILVRVPEKATPEQIAERRKRADEALAQLNSGAEFAKVAASFSDAGDALSGGELGWRSASRLPQLFWTPLRKSKRAKSRLSYAVRTAFISSKLLGDAAPIWSRPGRVPWSSKRLHVTS